MASEKDWRKGNLCPICDWPMASSWEEGCVPGNCSYRPDYGTPEYSRIQKRREALARLNASEDGNG